MLRNLTTLTEIDRDIVIAMVDCGALTVSQVARLFKLSPTAAASSLRRLRKVSLVAPHSTPTNRRLVWQPTSESFTAIFSEGLSQASYNLWGRTQHFFGHHLLINDVRVALTDGLAARSNLTDFIYHPYLPFKRRGLADAYAEYEYNGERLGVFVNADRENDGLSRWVAQAKRYDDSVRAGLRRRLGRDSVVVLIVTSSERKLARIQGICEKSSPQLFWLTTFGTLNRKGFFGTTWRRATDSGYRTLSHS